MWYFVLSFIAFLIVTWFIYKWAVGNKEFPDWEDFWFATIIFWLLGGLILTPIIGFGLVLPMTTGLAPDYKQGESVGYITDLKVEGLIWKTNEVWYLEGVGKQTAVGGPYKLSITDSSVVDQLKQLIGTDTRVKLKYDCWYLLPYRFGATDCLVTKVTVIG